MRSRRPRSMLFGVLVVMLVLLFAAGAWLFWLGLNTSPFAMPFAAAL